MGAHFSGLSLKKWPPSRAALELFFGYEKIHFGLPNMVGRTRSERRSSAAVSGGRADRGRQAAVNKLETDPNDPPWSASSSE
jgi:hypothetical protein